MSRATWRGRPGSDLGARRTVHWQDTEGDFDYLFDGKCADPLVPRLKKELQGCEACDAFMFVFNGHGEASVIWGAAPEESEAGQSATQMTDIVNAFCSHPNMQGKTKIILFDCCRYPGDQNAPPPQMLDPSAETFISFSTKLNAGSWITEGKGCEFTDALASTLEAKAR